MGLFSKIARKTGLVGVYITVVRHSRGQTRVIHSIWPPNEESFGEDKYEPIKDYETEDEEVKS